jgi:hypothetical protein
MRSLCLKTQLKIHITRAVSAKSWCAHTRNVHHAHYYLPVCLELLRQLRYCHSAFAGENRDFHLYSQRGVRESLFLTLDFTKTHEAFEMRRYHDGLFRLSSCQIKKVKSAAEKAFNLNRWQM